MVVSGRVDMSPRPDAEAVDQLLLRYRVAVDVADRYRANGFCVVIDDVIVGEMLERFLAMLPWHEVHLVVLDPELSAIRRREAERSKSAYDRTWTAGGLHRILHEQTSRLGWWLDSTRLTPGTTVDAILARPELSVVHLPVPVLSKGASD